MKTVLLAIALFISLSSIAQDKVKRDTAHAYDAGTKDPALTVTSTFSVWSSVLAEMNYAKERCHESNLTDIQKARIDSSITQISRYFINQLNEQLNKKQK